MKSFDELKALVAEAETEVIKVDNGNRTAGVRLRKLMQDTRNLAQMVRDSVLELRSGPAREVQATEITPKKP